MVSVFLVLSKKLNAYVYCTDCGHILRAVCAEYLTLFWSQWNIFLFCLFPLFTASALGLHKCLYFISSHEDFGSYLLETFILTTSFAIARSDAKETNVGFGAENTKLAARRLTTETDQTGKIFWWSARS